MARTPLRWGWKNPFTWWNSTFHVINIGESLWTRQNTFDDYSTYCSGGTFFFFYSLQNVSLDSHLEFISIFYFCVCGIDAMMILEISFVSVENEKKKRHILTLFLSAFREWRFFCLVFKYKVQFSSFVIVNHRTREAKRRTKKKKKKNRNATEQFNWKVFLPVKSQVFPFLVDCSAAEAVTKHELLTKVQPLSDVFPFKTNKSRKISSLEFLRYWKTTIFWKDREKTVLRDTKRDAFENKRQKMSK